MTGKDRSAINFRIEAKLRRELVEAAKASNRSLAAQIEWCIQYTLAAEPVIGDVKEYERKAKHAIDVRTGLEPFMSAEDAAKPFKPAPIVPPALKDAMKAAAREVLAEEGIKDAIRDVLADVGIVRRKGVA
jgi:hypothetical protein